MPIAFKCPHCRTTTDVDDHFAGQSGPCSHCGKLITIPSAPAAENSSARETHGQFGPAGGLIGIIVLLVIGVAMALLLMAALTTPHAAHRQAQSFNNLKQIALALHTYNAKYRTFPPAYIADENGRPMHSWRVLILPYMDQQALYDQYRFDEPWDGPNNRRLHALVPPMYADPSFPDDTSSHTNYAVITGENTMFPGAKAVKVRNVRDGLSTVLAVVSIGESDIVWCEPRDLEFDKMSLKINDPTRPGIKNETFSGAPVAMGDGSVRELEEEMPEQEVKSLILRNDGK